MQKRLKSISHNSLLLYDEDGKYTGQFSVVQKLADTLFGDKFNAYIPFNHLYALQEQVALRVLRH